ncbi:DUF4163 domain-containing protein [Sphingobium algorifonticola]|uniref:DUF4163 domain-containing protein n=1 Tax=Sphingobium algorifonticola TaxID=2008318 RepID=A0A437J544_9SPHN|nr:DUF4163 domain-containing protein [Sphingobium algorifonticola]RVT39893.1 DUF4163 domain-containing protein [Sphingobium algorifonticola]
MFTRLWAASVGAAGVAMALAACSPAASPGNAAPGSAAVPDTSRFARTPAPSPPAQAFNITETSDLLEYAYAYPVEAAAIPAIAARLTEDATRAQASAITMAREDEAAAKQSGYPYRRHSSQTSWTVKADTPRLLALLGELYFYTGGAHGNSGYKVLMWDKARNGETGVIAMATSPEALQQAIGARFCAALDAARAAKRGGPVMRGDDGFTRCVDPLKQSLIFASRDGKAIDSLLIVIGPYEAGPYSEGTYDIALPVDAALIAAMKPAFRDAFSAP